MGPRGLGGGLTSAMLVGLPLPEGEHVVGQLATPVPPPRITPATTAPAPTGGTNPTATATPASGGLPPRGSEAGEERMRGLAKHNRDPTGGGYDGPARVSDLGIFDPDSPGAAPDVSPFVGLGAADRERLQGALAGIDERYLANMASIDARGAASDPRQREVREAQVEHALRLAERMPMEDELAETQIGRQIEREQPYVEGFEYQPSAGEQFARAPEEELRGQAMNFIEMLQRAVQDGEQDPSTGLNPQGLERLRMMLGQALFGGNWGSLAGDPYSMLAQAGTPVPGDMGGQ